MKTNILLSIRLDNYQNISKENQVLLEKIIAEVLVLKMIFIDLMEIKAVIEVNHTVEDVWDTDFNPLNESVKKNKSKILEKTQIVCSNHSFRTNNYF